LQGEHDIIAAPKKPGIDAAVYHRSATPELIKDSDDDVVDPNIALLQQISSSLNTKRVAPFLDKREELSEASYSPKSSKQLAYLYLDGCRNRAGGGQHIDQVGCGK
jgi:hypothetical protein